MARADYNPTHRAVDDKGIPSSATENFRYGKPLSLWLAQIFLTLFSAIAAVLVAMNFHSDIRAAIHPAIMFAVSVALIAGVQRRAIWARLGLVLLFGYLCFGSISDLIITGVVTQGKRPLELEIRTEERVSAAAGHVLSAVALAALMVRAGFGAPAKRYFERATPRDDSVPT